MVPAVHPDVSVIMATRDRADVVGRAVASLKAQTFPNWQLVVVDDGSEDDTRDVIRDLDDGRIVYVRNEKPLGLPGARNVGLDHSVAKWVCFLDDDDEYLPAKLEVQVTRMRRATRSTYATYCGIQLLGSRRSYRPREGGEVIDDLLSLRDVGSVAPLLVDRGLATEIRFDEELVAEEDRDFRLRLAFASDLDAVPDVLYRVLRPPGGRLTSDVQRSLLGMESFARKHAALLDTRPDARATWEFRMFQRAVGARDYARARSHLDMTRSAGRRRVFIGGYRIAAALGDQPLRLAYALHCRARSNIRPALERITRGGIALVRS
jgi:glycosyltransferase involved in cell wall biosynthesis